MCLTGSSDEQVGYAVRRHDNYGHSPYRNSRSSVSYPARSSMHSYRSSRHNHPAYVEVGGGSHHGHGHGHGHHTNHHHHNNHHGVQAHNGRHDYKLVQHHGGHHSGGHHGYYGGHGGGGHFGGFSQ